MAQLLHEIEWGPPVLPMVSNDEWETEVKADIGFVPDILKRVSRSPWLRNVCLKWPRILVNEFSQHLGDIGALVVAQENACRYCYGVARSQMKLFGYSEKMIGSIEREMHLAELDEKDRAFIQFCRSLSRSNPRPPKAHREKLMGLGFSQLAVSEMAFLIANHCMVNRICTFLSCPLGNKFEKLENSWMGKIFRPFVAWKIRSMAFKDFSPLPSGIQSFPGVVEALTELPVASLLYDAIDGALSSKVLSDELKILMFAVIARSLECDFCQNESKNMAMEYGLSSEDFEAAITSLSSPRLDEQESKILAWTRETVHFQTGVMQGKIRQLAEEVDEVVLLESIGMAALANSVVRLAVLLG
jgi:alkylhydroperoxidase family enzyme